MLNDLPASELGKPVTRDSLETQLTHFEDSIIETLDKHLAIQKRLMVYMTIIAPVATVTLQALVS